MYYKCKSARKYPEPYDVTYFKTLTYAKAFVLAKVKPIPKKRILEPESTHQRQKFITNFNFLIICMLYPRGLTNP